MKVEIDVRGHINIHPFDMPERELPGPFGHIEVAKTGVIYLWVEPQFMNVAEVRRYAEALLRAVEEVEKGRK